MPTKPTPSAPAEPTPEEVRAAKLARLEKHRNRRPRHSFDKPLEYEIVGAGGKAAGPEYEINNAARAEGPPDNVEIKYVRQ